MKKLLIAGIAATALSGAPAFAADMPVKAAPTVAPAFNWTGFYIGANVGYAWGHGDINDLPATLVGPTTTRTLNFSPHGIVGGGELGYNWQFPSNVVFGVETDISAANLRDSKSYTIPTGLGPLNGTLEQKSDYFATARGRLGLVFDRTLLYGTGGIAWVPTKLSGNSTTIVGPFSFSDGAHTNSGWTAGAGVEWAFAPRWSAKLEYLHIDLGRHQYTTAPNVVGTSSLSLAERFDIVRFGLNYRFGGL